LSPATSLRDAEQVLRVARVRSVPVVRGERLVGLLSNRDVLARSLACGSERSGSELRRLLSRLSVDALVQPVEGVSPEEPIGRVARRLIDGDRGCVPVVCGAPGGPRLVGLLTESDLLRAIYPSRSADATHTKSPPGNGASDPTGAHD
ncbi:MAG: CBS domain-containing protein, partial [Myxococcota bacterium]